MHADDLTRSEWRRLQIQSRLHSKGGRSIGMALSRFNLPIMGINALTQMLIPPPKYTVDRLCPARWPAPPGSRELFIIERGAPRLADVGHRQSARPADGQHRRRVRLPAVPLPRPSHQHGAQDYHQLRAAEREILAGFLANVRAPRIASDSFSWADEIPQLLGTRWHRHSQRGSAGPATVATAPAGNGVAALGAARDRLTKVMA